MPRTAPAPNAIAIPGMNPGLLVAGGGGGGGGSGAGGGGGRGKRIRGAGKGGRKNPSGGKKSAPDPKKYPKCGTKSHPVDVVTGRAFTLPYEDFALPGPLELLFERSYSSHAIHRDVGIGPGWGHSLGWQLVEGARTISVWTGSAVEVRFEKPRKGNASVGEWNWRLERTSSGYELDADDGLVRTFGAVLGVKDEYRLVEIRDANRNSVHLAWDGFQLREIVDSVGRVCSITSDASGHVASIRLTDDGTGQRQSLDLVAFEYDRGGRLVHVRDPDGFRTRYEYSADGYLTLDEDKAGLAFHFVYDRLGRCVESWGDYPGRRDPSLVADVPTVLADGRTPVKGVHHCKFDYIDEGYTEVADSTQVGRFFGNEHGLLDKNVEGAGVESATYQDGRLSSRTDAAGGTVQYERDQSGRIVAVINELGVVTHFERNSSGLLTATTDHAGRRHVWERDQNGNVTYEVDEVGALTLYQYDGRGLIQQIITPDGGVTRAGYDAHGNMIELVQPNGGVWHWSYDALGRRTSDVDPLGATTRYGFSARGDLLWIEDPLGNVTRYTYDGEYNLLAIVMPSGARTEFEYGGYHVLALRRSPVGGIVRLGYNLEGELLEVWNENGERHRLERDTSGRLTAEAGFSRNAQYVLDLVGQMVGLRSGNGVGCTYSFDLAGNLLESELGDETVGFRYDERGYVVEATTERTSTELEYDECGRLTRERQTLEGESFTVEKVLNATGELVELRSSRGLDLRYERGILRTPVRIAGDGLDIRRSVDHLGREVLRSLGGSAAITTKRDAMGRAIERTVDRVAVGKDHGSAQSSDSQWRFAFDRDGELESQSNAAGVFTRYSYDLNGRVTSAQSHREGRVEFEHCTYDGFDNLFQEGASATYGVGGRLVERGGWQYGYDDAGLLTERWRQDEHGYREASQYLWGGSGLLAAVVDSNGGEMRFTYDGFGRRVLKELFRMKQGRLVLGASTRYLWLQDHLLHEVTTSYDGGKKNAERSFLFEEASFEPIAHAERTDSGTWAWHYYVNGPNGAPLALVGTDGAIETMLTWTLWGQVSFEGSNTTVPVRYQGQYWDEETGLCYNRFRYYSPELGRFISPDPTGLENSLNPYAIGGNLLSWIDPYGLDWNYRLVDSSGKVYYHGRASDNDTPAGVMSRHGRTTGSDGARMAKGDKLEVVTPTKTPKDVTRGVEQGGIVDGKTKTGTRSCGGKKGKVRGNKIAGSSNPKKAATHKAASDSFLQGKGLTSATQLPALSTHPKT